MLENLSPNMQMYLKTILQLEHEGQSLRVKTIARALGVTMPSVSQALDSLREKGLIRHRTYGKVHLSESGRSAAEAVAERYGVLYQFLTNVLGVDERTAQHEACRIEHVLGPRTLNRLKAFLDFLNRCRPDRDEILEQFHDYVQWRRAGDNRVDWETSSQALLSPSVST